MSKPGSQEEHPLRDLELLVRARHALITVESTEEERLQRLLEDTAARAGLPLFTWVEHQGLRRSDRQASSLSGTTDPVQCLAYIEEVDAPYLFYLRGIHRHFDKPLVVARMKSIEALYRQHQGAVVMVMPSFEAPPDLAPLITQLELPQPTERDYFDYIQELVRELGEHQRLRVQLSREDVSVLLQHLKGLSFLEVRKIISRAVVEDGLLNRDDLKEVLVEKRRLIQSSGVLEFFPCDHAMDDIAGLSELKLWLRKRRAAFSDPQKAIDFGLTPPKGVLLLGVQGCGKSLCAKAVAQEWSLPLIRLDPSSLYQKYYGESEKNFAKAVRTAEALAPVCLWIDEIEKAFGQDDKDSGTSGRVFATFLSWLQEKDESVFVIATANDISKLPPELLRKGRFDEIFFVDLPSRDTRAEVFKIHLRRRNRDPSGFDLEALADHSDGFSGAEIEQAVVSSLYTAFSKGGEVTTEDLLEELKLTRPLSVTMAEKIEDLRAWASDRAVSAGT